MSKTKDKDEVKPLAHLDTDGNPVTEEAPAKEESEAAA